MSHWLTITVILIVCITLLAWFFSETGDRMLAAYIALTASTSIALMAWLVYITVHFLHKYW